MTIHLLKDVLAPLDRAESEVSYIAIRNTARNSITSSETADPDYINVQYDHLSTESDPELFFRAKTSQP